VDLLAEALQLCEVIGALWRSRVDLGLQDKEVGLPGRGSTVMDHQVREDPIVAEPLAVNDPAVAVPAVYSRSTDQCPDR
jgi:hypothetical protein